jgi:transcription initiation factor TFIIH subunit 1
MVILQLLFLCAPGHKFNKVDGNKPALLNLSKDSDKV